MSKIRRIPGQGRGATAAAVSDTPQAAVSDRTNDNESLVSAGFIRWRDEEMEIFLPAGVTARSIGVATINGGAR